MSEVFHAFLPKGLVAAMLSSIIELTRIVYGGEAIVFYVWLVFFFLDFFLGSLKAVLWREWTLRKFMGGTKKFVIYLGSIAAINLLCLSLSVTLDFSIPIVVNSFIFVLTLTDSMSAITHAESMGWEIPAVLKFVVNKWRRKSLSFMLKQLGEETEDSEVLAFIASQRQEEDGRRKRTCPDTGERRRDTDNLANQNKDRRDNNEED